MSDYQKPNQNIPSDKNKIPGKDDLNRKPGDANKNRTDQSKL